MELITILAWPLAICFIALVGHSSYKASQDKRNELLEGEVRRIQLENRDLIAKIERKAGNDLNEAEKRLEKLYLDLDSKVTIIQNGLQWQKK